jgi:EAL domain-containing protein (putative c-di-GMP-specific phosphodiesterase class I)
MVAALSLVGPGGPFGLLVLRDAPGPDGPTGFARRLPLFLELSETTATLLRPGLEAGEAQLRARAGLESIIAAGAFTPHFQPVVYLADRAIAGHEALTRFDDGVPPDVHFAEAARLGLEHELERATLAAAIPAARGLSGGGFLALNVSPGFVLASPELPALLAGTDRAVVLEITEHAQVDDYGALRAALARIEPPVAVAVDDAGSGYASLRHILALRPAYVKLDLSWVRDIDADPARQALVAGLAHFAAETGCALIGEGIETEAERSTLLRLNVPLGQGYLFGRPAPVGQAAPARVA